MRCFWRGKFNCTFKVVEYLTGNPRAVSHWQNLYIGKRRQGILLNIEGKEPMLIDNEFGQGFENITVGLGELPALVVVNSQVFEHYTVPEEKWNRKTNHLKRKIHNRRLTQYLFKIKQ